MRSDEVAIAEAVAALTARLTTWGIEDPHAKAHQYVTDMLRNGWRPRARPVETPSWNPNRTPPPADLMAAMRADIAAAQHPTTSPHVAAMLAGAEERLARPATTDSPADIQARIDALAGPTTSPETGEIEETA